MRILRFVIAFLLAVLAVPDIAVAGWHLETVDSTGDVGDWTSISLDAGGNPHISYVDATNDDLKYAYHNGASWQIETVDSTGNVGYHTSIALDAGGNPHISYFDATNDDLKYAVLFSNMSMPCIPLLLLE